MLSGQQQQSFSYLNDDTYTALILEEAEKLYNQFITNLTNVFYGSSGSMLGDHRYRYQLTITPRNYP